jgi:hypothetical protein
MAKLLQAAIHPQIDGVADVNVGRSNVNAVLGDQLLAREKRLSKLFQGHDLVRSPGKFVDHGLNLLRIIDHLRLMFLWRSTE